MRMVSHMDAKDLVVSKALWETWVEREDVSELWSDIDVDASCKRDLFDALDVDCRDELSLQTIIEGLMSLRGPITKLDIVSTRLKATRTMRLVLGLCRKLGAPLDSHHVATSDLFGI